MRTNRRAGRLARACLTGLALGPLLIGSLPPRSYEQDLQVDYLMAKALLEGRDVYAPLTELSSRYFPIATHNFPHPSPHPPVLAALAVPLTVLPYWFLPPIWLASNIALLLLVGRRLGLGHEQSLMLLAWPPLWCVLYIGQLEVAVLALAVAAWKSSDSGNDLRAGICLGLAGALKLYPLLFLVPYALGRRLKVLCAAGVVFASIQIANLALVGAADLRRYYFEILPAVTSLYAAQGLNGAPYGMLLRLFGGASDVSPILHLPDVVLPLTVVFSAFAVVALLTLRPVAAPLATLVALPTAWYYSVVLGLPQIIHLIRSRLRAPAMLAAALASVVLPAVNLFIAWATASMPAQGGMTVLPAILLALQPVGVLWLLVLSLIEARSRVSRRA